MGVEHWRLLSSFPNNHFRQSAQKYRRLGSRIEPAERVSISRLMKSSG